MFNKISEHNRKPTKMCLKKRFILNLACTDNTQYIRQDFVTIFENSDQRSCYDCQNANKNRASIEQDFNLACSFTIYSFNCRLFWSKWDACK